MKKYAILIGINGYHESLGALNYCVNDAKLMYETLTSECCAFPADSIVLLTDDQPKERTPTFGNIHSWLGTWLSRPGPDDLVLVYFAGHGRESNGQALLAPSDATLESLSVTGIPIPYVRDMLDRCRAAQKVLVLDACHSGAGRDVATMSCGFRNELESGKGLYTIASCDADQISYEWPEKKQGIFTHYLVDAICRSAPVGTDGRITLDRVYETASRAILNWTAGKRLRQEPVRICRAKGDIHIATRSLSLEQQLEAAKAQIQSQEETIARLREESKRLADENDKLIKNTSIQAKIVANKKPKKSSRITVREWKDWFINVGLLSSDLQLITLMVLPPGIILFLIAMNAFETQNWTPFIGITLTWLFTFIVMVTRMRLKWKNKYRLYCLQECSKGNDFVGASVYAESMGRLGIDLGTGAAAVCSAADMAVENEDVEHAKALYRLAQKRWKSPHAKRALNDLESDNPEE